eukprot:8260727-Heterocapsa_arctica.AAC.1
MTMHSKGHVVGDAMIFYYVSLAGVTATRPAKQSVAALRWPTQSGLREYLGRLGIQWTLQITKLDRRLS